MKEWRKDDGGGGGGKRGAGGWRKEAMSHISDLDPRGLLFTLVTPLRARMCVCMCVCGGMCKWSVCWEPIGQTVWSLSKNTAE